MEEKVTIATRPEFEAHKLNETGQSRAADVRKLFSVHLNNLEAVIGGGGREAALVRTKLEEACMFAVRAVAANPENRE